MEKNIRSVAVADADTVRNIYAPSVADSATSFELHPPDVSTMAERIERLKDRYPWLVFEYDSQVLGYAYASPHRNDRAAYRWCVEVSVYVDARARSRGVGRSLYNALFDVLRRQGYVNAYAGITLPNPASVALHRSMGFETVGVYSRIGYKLDRWHDVSWHQLRLLDDPAPVESPSPATRILRTEDATELLYAYAQTARLE